MPLNTLQTILSSTNQLALTLPHPLQRAWVSADTLYILTSEGVYCVPVKDSVIDPAMDIMEMSQSQPEMMVRFDHPAVSSFVSEDMSILLVVQIVQDRILSLVTICILDWTVTSGYNCHGLQYTKGVTSVWVCSLPTHWLPAGQLPGSTAAQLKVVTAGTQTVFTDGKTSCHKQLDCPTSRGQFLAQFLSQSVPQLHISSLASLASVLHKEDTEGLSCRLLSSSVKDLVMEKDMLAILTKKGEVLKMIRKVGQLVPQPLLTGVESITLVGDVLTAVTKDGLVYKFNMSEHDDKLENGKLDRLKMNHTGDVLKRILDESQKIETTGRATADMMAYLQQLKTLHLLLLEDPLKMFVTEVSVEAADIFSQQLSLNVKFRNISNSNLIGKFWCLKLDIFPSQNKCWQSKTVPLPPSFSCQETISCVLPLLDKEPDQFPLVVRSHLVLKGDLLGGGLVPSATLVTSKVSVLDVLKMTGVGLGDRRLETDREMFYRSLETGGEHINSDIKGSGGETLTFSIERNLLASKGGKLGDILAKSENTVTVWNFFNTVVKISNNREENSNLVHITLAGDNSKLLKAVRKDIEHTVGT